MKKLGITSLIKQIKDELAGYNDDTNIFFIDEVNIEINFTVEGKMDGGFDIGVVMVGSDVSEQRVQKISLKLIPLISKEELLKLKSKQATENIARRTQAALFKSGKQK